MRLTRFGFKGAVFYLLMLVAFYASPYSNLFFLLLGFLTLLGACGVLSARRNLAGVGASFAALAPVPTGSVVHLPVELRATKRARFLVEAHVELAGGRRLSGRADLLEHSTTLSVETGPLARGCYAVERARLESRHPFGVVRVWSDVPVADELVVYPAPTGLIEGRTAAQALDELFASGTRVDGDLQPSSLRDHRDGEGVRGIHWRASARRGRLVVQEWEGGAGHGLEVVLDRRCDSEELEVALGTLSAMVELARTSKETLHIHSQEHSVTYGETYRPWSEALRFLALAAPVPKHGPAPPPTSPAVARLPRSHAHV